MIKVIDLSLWLSLQDVVIGAKVIVIEIIKGLKGRAVQFIGRWEENLPSVSEIICGFHFRLLLY